MSSQEVLEANVAAIRSDLNELKIDFRAAVRRLDERIDAAVAKLESEIRAMAAKAERELQQFATRIETQLAEMRAEDRTLRDKLEALNEKVIVVDRKVDQIGTKLNALLWVVGGLGTLATVIVTVGNALHWF